MTHAGLKDARALVVTVPDESAGAIIVGSAREIAPNLPIIARAATHSGVHQLGELGAKVVIHPELEGGLEVMRHTLNLLGYPTSQVQQYTDAVRNDQYNTEVSTTEERRVLEQLVESLQGMEITWRSVGPTSELINRTVAEANLRARTGASIVALVRQQQVFANPKSTMTFAAGDLVGLIGDAGQVVLAEAILDPAASVDPGSSRPAPGERRTLPAEAS